MVGPGRLEPPTNGLRVAARIINLFTHIFNYVTVNLLKLSWGVKYV